MLNRKPDIFSRIATASLLVVLLLCSAGCVSVLIAGAGGGISYTLSNVAYKTVNYPLDDVRRAVHDALEKMAIKEIQATQTEKGIRINAVTMDLKIYIDLVWITYKTTRISVDARKNLILKDKATAAAIIEQTDGILATKNN
ncbi:MAG TPA: DUF3568 family protein [Dissulfurispiraceae bacterium]|nr:DUF3568 family protein [Dissulfurispiraceae bacterium]